MADAMAEVTGVSDDRDLTNGRLTRQQRRAIDREASSGRITELRTPILPAAMCRPGHHAFAEVVGTVDGKPVATVVMCSICRRTFGQVMEESPEDLAMYRAFLEHEKAAAEHSHEPPADGLPVEGCAGCARIAALDHSEPGDIA